MKDYVSSDWHIGYEHANYININKFIDLAEDDADRVILLGDVFDMWRYPLNSMNVIDRDKVINLSQRILKMSNKVKVDIIPGNHDHTLKSTWKYDQYKYPNITIRGPFIDKGIYYTHGWEYDAKQYAFSFLFSIFPHIIPFLYQLFARKPSEILQRSDVPGEVVMQIHENAQKDADDKGVQYVMMGHTHIPMIKGNVIDVGDMVDSGSYVVVEDGVPELKYL